MYKFCEAAKNMHYYSLEPQVRTNENPVLFLCGRRQKCLAFVRIHKNFCRGQEYFSQEKIFGLKMVRDLSAVRAL